MLCLLFYVAFNIFYFKIKQPKDRFIIIYIMRIDIKLLFNGFINTRGTRGRNIYLFKFQSIYIKMLKDNQRSSLN